MLLMVEKGIRGGIHHSTYWCNKYKKGHDKNKESLYILYWDTDNLYGWSMPQKLPVNNFEWIKRLRLHKKAIMKKVVKDIF